MNQTSHPSKEMVREWLKNQIGQHCPPPSPMQIRQALGWKNEELSMPAHLRGACLK